MQCLPGSFVQQQALFGRLDQLGVFGITRPFAFPISGLAGIVCKQHGNAGTNEHHGRASAPRLGLLAIPFLSQIRGHIADDGVSTIPEQAFHSRDQFHKRPTHYPPVSSEFPETEMLRK